jgi:arylformamidase
VAGVIHDITPPVTPDLAVWPGDTPASREVLLDLNRGDFVTLSTLRATVHLGAHADAPNHYGADAESIETRPVERYIGPCEVVTARVERGARVSMDDLARTPTAPRVLIRTGSHPDPTRFNEDFAALEASLIDALAERGVVLVGIDTPSVDLFQSKDLPSHQALLRNDLAVLEGLALEGVSDGVYELIAPPLKLTGFDASPVRALLREV